MTREEALEKEPCEDAISRQAVKDLYYKNGYIDFRKMCELPPVTPQPKTAHWIAVENEEMETVGYYCSECDLPMETEQRTNFCPNCGAKMRGEQ